MPVPRNTPLSGGSILRAGGPQDGRARTQLLAEKRQGKVGRPWGPAWMSIRDEWSVPGLGRAGPPSVQPPQSGQGANKGGYNFPVRFTLAIMAGCPPACTQGNSPTEPITDFENRYSGWARILHWFLGGHETRPDKDSRTVDRWPQKRQSLGAINFWPNAGRAPVEVAPSLGACSLRRAGHRRWNLCFVQEAHGAGPMVDVSLDRDRCDLFGSKH